MVNHPPFMPFKLVEKGTPEHEATELHCAFFLHSENQSTWHRHSAAGEYYEHLMSEILTGNTSQLRHLSADPEIPGSASNGKLALPNVKAAIKQIINSVEEEFLDGVTNVYVIHPPSLQENAIRTMSSLPAAGLDSSTKLISVRRVGKPLVFPIETFSMKLHRAPFESTGWMTILFNPDRPVVKIPVPVSQPTAFLAPLYGFGNTEDIERRAMDAIASQLDTGAISVTRSIHEPNGDTTFPDFEVTIRGQDWSIEVSRLLKGVADGRVIKVGNPRQTAMTINASKTPPIIEQTLHEAITCAITEKSAKAAECRPGTKYCLALVNVVDLNIAKEEYDWTKQDLSKFDFVLLLRFQPGPKIEIENIKGNLIPI